MPSSDSYPKMSQFSQSQGDHMEMLSKEEQEFGFKYRDLKRTHLMKINQSHLPENYRSLPPELLNPPNLDEYVFVRALKELPDIMLDDAGEETISLPPDSVGVVRYRPFQQLLR